MPMATLSERDMRILAFERSWWRQPGAKEQAISDMLGLSATRYYQLLNDLIDRPEALGFDPVRVKRLRRQRTRRNRMRAGGPAAEAGRRRRLRGGAGPRPRGAGSLRRGARALRG